MIEKNPALLGLYTTVLGAAVFSLQNPAWSAPELSTTKPVTTIQPTLINITLPKVAEFPGSGITLTQPVNMLQAIPPATSKLPNPSLMD